MELYILIAIVATLVHASSTVYSKQLYSLADHPAQVAHYSIIAPGLVFLLVLPFIEFHGLGDHWWKLLGISFAFVIGYLSQLWAVQHGDASFIVPLLGLKAFFVAGLSALFLSEYYGPLVYLGMAGAIAGMFLLGDGRLAKSLPIIGLVVLATLMFASADVVLVGLYKNGFNTLETMFYLFSLSPLLMLPFSAVQLKGKWSLNWRFSRGLLIYALLQLAGGGLLMYAFWLASQATLINIIQSSRGLFAIALVYLLGRAGLQGIENLTRQQYVTRTTGAALMTLSICLAVLAR